MSDNEGQLNVIGAIKYRKTVWGLVKTFIEKNTWSGLEDFYSNLARALHAETTTQPRGAANAKIRRKTKSHRKSAKSQKNAAVNDFEDGEEEEDDYEEVESVKDVNSNSRVLPNHQVNSSHPRPRSSSLQDSSTLNDNLIKIILLLLSCLLLANSYLFYKMWRLEVGLASSPLSNLEEVLIATARGQHEDLGLGAGKALDQETWLKILQRQEAEHQLELHKWHDLLGNAATLLKQTEESLKNLQKSIHPLAINKLKGLLDLQEELVLGTNEKGPKEATSNENAHRLKT